MTKYRVKEKNGHFYPQEKYIGTMWFWNTMLRETCLQYELRLH